MPDNKKAQTTGYKDNQYGNSKKINLHKNHKSRKQINQNILLLAPIVFIAAILPLIIRLKPYVTPLSKFTWFSSYNGYDDFFLIYKKDFLIFIAIIMILVIVYKAFMDKRSIKMLPLFLPLAIYATLIFFSSVISKYRYYSLEGVFEQFESLYVVLAYCIITYYVFLFVQTEKDIELIIFGLVFCVIILSIIGITQSTGHDIFATEFGKKLIIPKKYWFKVDELEFHFGGWAYLTLYNPNYVGVYVAMVAPLLLTLIMFLKKDWKIVVYIIGFAGMMLCLYGSHSDAGIITYVITLVFLLLLMWRYIVKYRKVTLPIAGVGIVAMIIILAFYGGTIVNKFEGFMQSARNNYSLKSIETNDNGIKIDYNNNILHAQLIVDKGLGYCLLTDENGQQINMQPNADGTYTVIDDRFPGFIAAPCLYDGVPSFFVQIEGKQWVFTNQTEDGTYYYINQYGKYDKIVNAPSVIFNDYEHLFTNRGFIWSKTIPLLKKYIILGSGADTFPLVYPQNDYVNIHNVGITNQLISKPHSLYLQIAVQSGVLSLIAFLAFYCMYFIWSIKLYIKGIFNSYFAQVGVGIMVGTFGYMICGITNDSNLSVAPIFWLFMGLGIVCNIKAAPFIEEEIKRIKAEKSMKVKSE